MIRKIALSVLLLTLASSISSFGATKVLNAATSGTAVDHVQVWISGGNDFNAGSYATPPTLYALAAASTMKVWVSGMSGTQSATYNSATVTSYWGTPTVDWQNWIGDVTNNGITKKVAVMEAPSYIMGSEIDYRINFISDPATNAIVNIQYYKDGVLVEARKYTKLTPASATDIPNVGNTTWSLDKTPANQGDFNPGFIPIAPPYVDVADIAALKTKVDQTVRLTGTVTVTCKGSSLYFVGEESHKGCIKVVAGTHTVPASGSFVNNLIGVVTQDTYGQYILTLNADAGTATSGTTVKAVGVTNRSAKNDTKLLTNLVKVWGLVGTGTDYTLDDGYGSPLTVKKGVAGQPTGFVAVTGVLWKEAEGTVLYQDYVPVPISGKVTDQAAAAIPGAHVYIKSSPNASVNPNYTLTVDSSGNYSQVVANGTWYITASATGYSTPTEQSVVVNGVPVTGVNFTLNQIVTHTITASAGTGGTITPSGAVVVNDGSNQSFTIAATSGYTISDVVVDSVSQGAIASYTFTNVTANHTISATFVASPTHTITASAGAGGTITPSGSVVVNHGSNQSFTIAANSGYTIASVVVDSVSQGAITSYTFTNVTADHTISATFNSTGGGPTPVAFYEFENNVNDTQGAFNGTAYGTPTYVTGKVGAKAIQLNGSSQYVTIARPVSTDWTIAFFVKTTQTSLTGTQWYSGSGLIDGEVGGTALDFGITYLNSKVAFGVGSTDTTIQSSTTINSGNWTHVACSRNGTTGQMKVYINGGLQTTSTGPTGARTAPANLHIGNLQTNANYFSGTIDQLKIFSSVLTASDITTLVAEGGTTTWWTITATAGTGGTISPSGGVSVAQGDSQTFTITPSPFYSTVDVVVDGVSQGGITSYTFTNVTANHTISATFTGTGLAGLVTGPYLQALTQNSVYVLAEMDSTTPITVEWGIDTDYGLKSYTESTETTTSTPASYVHNVKLSGLLANTLYHYCLTINGQRGADHTFTTMVNPGTNFKFAVAADFKGGTTVHDSVSNLIAAAAPRFSLYGGDLCNTSDSDTLRREFFRAPELALSASVPFFNSTGNHESWSQSAQAFTQGPASSSGAQGYYSFDCGDVHFVNVNNYISYGVGSTQYNWVAADLAASNKPWKVVWNHNPPYTSTSDGHGEDSSMITMANNLFVPNHVDVVFNGHNHFYQHNLVNGIHYMIVGSAGAGLYTPTTGSYTVYSAKSYCYAIINVTPTTFSYTAYNDSGVVLETLNLTKQFTISGKVQTSGGTGIYNAVVATGGPNSNITPVVTDSSGNYTLSVPGPGTYELYADALGYNASFGNVTLSTSGTVTNNVTLTAAAENGVYNGGMETVGSGMPDGWESFIQKPADVDYYGNAWPDKPDMYTFNRSTTSGTYASGAASAMLATASALTNYQVLRYERWRVSGDACTGITETTLVDSARAWNTNTWVGAGTGYVQIVHGGTDSGTPPTFTNDYNVLSNDATSLTVPAGSNLATTGYAAGDHYRFLTQIRNYWYTGGIRTAAANRIPVDRTHVYNFYLKQKTTYSGSETQTELKSHVYALVWRDSGGAEISRSEWRWQPGTSFTQSTPRLFVAPPAGAATVEALVYTKCVDNANRNWTDTSYVDDVVIDPVPATATGSLKSVSDGTHVVVPGNFVSLAPRDTSNERSTNYFYVSEPDGSAGIRVQSAAPKMDNLFVDDIVGISGVVRSDATSGEKYIQANVVGTPVSMGGAAPVATTVAGALTGTNAVGNYVSVIGQISSIASDLSSFNITDSGNTIKVNSVGYPLLSSFATVGTSLKVNGVVSKEGSTRVILMMTYSRQTTAFPDNDITFFGISDTHYGSTWANRTIHKQRIAAMNALPGTAYPSSVGGGVVGECRGVTVTGDITDNDNNKAGEYADFASDFGINGNSQLRFPVYEGTGNHDGGLSFGTADGMIKRNPYRAGLVGLSPDGWNYSFDIGRVHFIDTNEIGSYLDQNSMNWIANDLATNVGSSGRPVVILQHEGFDSFSFAFISRGEAKKTYEVIKNYNVIAIIWGHTGGYAQYKWGGIDTFGTDGTMNGFHVFHITPTQLICVCRDWSTGTWMTNWTFTKTITGMQ